MSEPKTLSEKIWESHVVSSPLQEQARRAALAESGEADEGLLHRARLQEHVLLVRRRVLADLVVEHRDPHR